jgi:hypothetical protein
LLQPKYKQFSIRLKSRKTKSHKEPPQKTKSDPNGSLQIQAPVERAGALESKRAPEGESPSLVELNTSNQK